MQNAPRPFVIRRVYNAFAYFLKAETAGGVALFAAALLAIFVANTPGLREWRLDALAMPMGFAMGSGVFTLSVEHIINDGLMAVFFLLVGMEIKREMLAGELSTRAKAVLPAIAAVGGMAAPALIYTAANWGDGVALRGWAIPTATDIAFSLGVLSLTGKRAPLSIKIFLTAIAIIDDLLAIAIIAVFYTESLRAAPLALSALVLYGLFLLNKNGVRALWPYLLGGLGLWGLTLASGLHATLAGVFTAAAIPLARGEENRIHHIADRPVSPLEFLEHNLHLPVTFFHLAAVRVRQRRSRFHRLVDRRSRASDSARNRFRLGRGQNNRDFRRDLARGQKRLRADAGRRALARDFMRVAFVRDRIHGFAFHRSLVVSGRRRKFQSRQTRRVARLADRRNRRADSDANRLSARRPRGQTMKSRARAAAFLRLVFTFAFAFTLAATAMGGEERDEPIGFALAAELRAANAAEASLGGATWRVEIAADEEARKQGLSGRRALADDGGMLFVSKRRAAFACGCATLCCRSTPFF